MAKKTKNPNRLGFKSYCGTALMSFTDSFGAGLMTSWFMAYLTDYAGIGTWGAILGTGLLLFARLFDAVNDPLQGWIMDKAKVGKLGKYKPFIILSIIMQVVGIGALFFLPSGLKDSPVGICAWVIVGYLLYDMGSSFFSPNLIYRTLTMDSTQRGKLMIAPRMVNIIIGMVTGAIISIVNGVNATMNNLHTAFGVTVLVMMTASGVISLLGIAMIKERYHAKSEDTDERVKLSDIVVLMKENAALRCSFLSNMFGGFIWTFLFATCMYYIKWAFCADLTTGAVDAGKFGMLSLIASMMMLVPLLLGTAVAVPLMKVFKTPIRTFRFVILMEAISCGVLYLLQVLGILANSPVLFFVCMAVCATAIGIGFIPGEALNIQNMDYEIHKNGRDRSALCNAAMKFLNKTQTAISSSVVGAILVAVGYIVDSTTGEYIGELSAIPSMLNWFIVVMGLVPCILGVISLVIMRNYPITPEIAEDMKNKLAASSAHE